MDRIQFRRDTKANWEKYNPVLMEGEMGIVTDTKEYKIGDGVNDWNSLEYMTDSTQVLDELGYNSTAAVSQNIVSKTFLERELYNRYEYQKSLTCFDIQDTENLFVPKSFIPYTFKNSDSDELIYSDTFAISKVRVTSGITYYKYSGTMLSSWKSCYVRVYDDTGMLLRTQETSITIPDDAQNPYVYLIVYQNDEDINQYMFSSNSAPSEYVPSSSCDMISNINKAVSDISNIVGFYSAYKGFIQIDTVREKVRIKGTIYINTTNSLANKLTFKSISYDNTETDFNITADLSAINYLYLYDGHVYLGSRAALNELIDGENNPVILGYGSINSKGDNFKVFGNKLLIDDIIYCDYSNVVKKIVNRTENLFNYQDQSHVNEVYHDDGYWYDYANMNTVVIKLTAGATYNRYNSAGVLGTWGTANFKIFDEGTMILRDNTDTFTVPVNAVNPIGYFFFYNNGLGGDRTKFMLLDSTVDGSEFIPYNNCEFEPDLEEHVKSMIQSKSMSNRFADRPNGGYEVFLVDVDVNISTTNSTSTAVADLSNIKQDRGIIAFPTNYSSNGKPTRLVICGHGTGWKCTESTVIPWAGMNTQLLLDEGYAVLGCNGTPGDINGRDQGHNGTPQCYRSILAAYKYVTGKYNIATDGVFTVGLSLGTLMTMQIACFTDIPILAQVVYSANMDIMKATFSYKVAERKRICTDFGFTGTAPIFTSNNPPSEEEQQYVLNNFDKWCGYCPLINGVTGKAKDTYSVWPSSSTLENSEEKALYSDLSIIRKIPIKFFLCDDDTIVSPRWTDYMSTMLRNAGCYCEVRHYATGGHNSWKVGDNVEVTTLLGGTKIVNGSSYEGLLFLKRFDL